METRKECEIKEKESPLFKFFSLIGIVIGGLIGWYIGRNSWFLLVMVGLSFIIFYWLASKIAKPEAKPMLPAIGMMGGNLAVFTYLISLFFEKAASEPLYYAAFFDVVFIFAGILWLIFRPGLIPVIILVIYQSLSVFSAIIELLFSELAYSSNFLLVLTLKVFIIVSLILGYSNFKKNLQQ